jgi:hypothetical protein
MCSAYIQDQDSKTFTMGFLAPFDHLGDERLHHPVFEYPAINKSACLMPYFAVHLGNPEQSQICIKGVPWDDQQRPHEASVAENAADQSFRLSHSVYRDWHGIYLNFLP